MFQVMLFIASMLAFIIGGLVVLIGIGAIAGCVGGLLMMTVGAIMACIGIWSLITFLMPPPPQTLSSSPHIIDLAQFNGKWA